MERAQKPNKNGAINLMDWPGWGDTALRRFAELARAYNPPVFTGTQSFNDLLNAQPGSGMSLAITGRASPESKEGN